MPSDSELVREIRLKMQHIRSRADRNSSAMHFHTTQIMNWKDQLLRKLAFGVAATSAVAVLSVIAVKLINRYVLVKQIPEPLTNKQIKALPVQRQSLVKSIIARASSSLIGFVVPLVMRQLTDRLAGPTRGMQE